MSNSIFDFFEKDLDDVKQKQKNKMTARRF
jgi:hypothetical protein